MEGPTTWLVKNLLPRLQNRIARLWRCCHGWCRLSDPTTVQLPEPESASMFVIIGLNETPKDLALAQGVNLIRDVHKGSPRNPIYLLCIQSNLKHFDVPSYLLNNNELRFSRSAFLMLSKELSRLQLKVGLTIYGRPDIESHVIST